MCSKDVNKAKEFDHFWSMDFTHDAIIREFLRSWRVLQCREMGRGGGGVTFADRLYASLALALRVCPDPNNDSPLNTDAAQLWSDQEKYREVCLQKYRDGGGKA